MVEEVLLGLIENQQEVAGESVRPPPERVAERLAVHLVQKRRAELSGESVSRRRSQAVGGLFAPAVEDDHGELGMAAFVDVHARLFA